MNKIVAIYALLGGAVTYVIGTVGPFTFSEARSAVYFESNLLWKTVVAGALVGAIVGYLKYSGKDT